MGYFSYWIAKSKESGLVRKLVSDYMEGKAHSGAAGGGGSSSSTNDPKESNIIG